MHFGVQVFQTDDSTWCARAHDGPTVFTSNPEEAARVAILAWRAKRLAVRLLGRGLTVADIKRLVQRRHLRRSPPAAA